MKILVLNGSPKNSKSNTMRITNAFLQGLKPENCDLVDLYSLNIQECRGRFSCWFKTPGKCFINDDVQDLISSYLAADLVIWSFPLHCFSVPSRVILLMERFLPLLLPDITTSVIGNAHLSRYYLSGKKTVIISTCGFATPERNYDAVRFIFDRLSDQGMCNPNYLTIFAPAGEFLHMRSMRPYVDYYLGIVRKAGEEFAQGEVGIATAKELSEPFIPNHIFSEYMASLVKNVPAYKNNSMYEFIHENIEEVRNDTALCFEGKTFTYGGLFELIDAAADGFYALGVRKGTVVTLHLPNCPQIVVAVYALAKLGAVCSMVQSTVPPQPLFEQMKLTGSNYLISAQNLTDVAECVSFIYVNPTDKFPPEPCSIMPKSKNFSFGLLLTLSHASAPFTSVQDEDPVFYLQSTGTTSVPKTVILSHGACNGWVAGMHEFIEGAPQRGRPFLSAMPMFHGAGLISVLHLSLYERMKYVMIARFIPEEAVNLIKNLKVKVMLGVPAFYESLLAVPGFQEASGASLEECFICGDKVSPSLKRDFDTRVDPTGNRHLLYESYGLTEYTTAVSMTNAKHYESNAAGHLMPGCIAAIQTDDGLRPCGTGELFVHGPAMMSGYLGESDETSFLIDADGQKWARTGDICTLSDDGYLQVVGRVKNIIIHNGYNIIPEEVEAVIKKNEHIKQCCVVGRQADSESNSTVVAFVRSDCEPGFDLFGELQKLCEKHLPYYAIPKEFILVESLPYNRFGKIDRKRLEQGNA